MCLWAQVPGNSLILMPWLEIPWDFPPLVGTSACGCTGLVNVPGDLSWASWVLLENAPNPSLALPPSPTPSLPSAQPPFSVKGPPSPELPEPDPKRIHPCRPPPPLPSPVNHQALPFLPPKCQHLSALPPRLWLPHSNQGLSGLAFLPTGPSAYIHLFPRGSFSTAARVNSKKGASYHLVHLLKITQGLPVALRVRVRIPNEAVGSGPSLPVQPLLPAGLPSPLWPSSISFLRAFVSAVPSAWSTRPHHFQLANVNQVSAYLSSPKRTLHLCPLRISLYLLPQCPMASGSCHSETVPQFGVLLLSAYLFTVCLPLKGRGQVFYSPLCPGPRTREPCKYLQSPVNI